jgi:hypothetical protein
MKYSLRQLAGVTSSPVVTLRCPICRHVGSFQGLPNCNDVAWQEPHGVLNQGGARMRRMLEVINNGRRSKLADDAMATQTVAIKAYLSAARKMLTIS